MRSRKYGIQPIPPSESAILRPGNFVKISEKTSSEAQLNRRDGRAGDHDLDRRVHVLHARARAGADVDADDRALVGAGLPEGIPVRVVQARIAEGAGVVGEGDGVAALAGDAPHLAGHLLGVPDGRDRQGDEAAGMSAAPVVDVPVVVGAQHGDGELALAGRGLAAEELADETRHRGEAERSQHAVDVHVVDARVDVVAAGPQLRERGRLHAVLLGGAARHGVQPHVGDLLALEHPDVGAVLLRDEPRRAILPLRGEMALPHVRRLTDVVVDAHQDHVVHLHGQSSSDVQSEIDCAS